MFGHLATVLRRTISYICGDVINSLPVDPWGLPPTTDMRRSGARGPLRTTIWVKVFLDRFRN